MENISEIIKIVRVPYKWWRQLTAPRFVLGDLLVLADWLTDQGDDLHANAWREVYNLGVIPLRLKEYDHWWIVEDYIKMSSEYFHWFKYYGITTDSPLFKQAIISRELYSFIQSVDTKASVHPFVEGRIINEIVSFKKYYSSSNIGRGWAYTSLVHGMCLKLHGFKPVTKYYQE